MAAIRKGFRNFSSDTKCKVVQSSISLSKNDVKFDSVNKTCTQSEGHITCASRCQNGESDKLTEKRSKIVRKAPSSPNIKRLVGVSKTIEYDMVYLRKRRNLLLHEVKRKLVEDEISVACNDVLRERSRAKECELMSTLNERGFAILGGDTRNALAHQQQKSCNSSMKNALCIIHVGNEEQREDNSYGKKLLRNLAIAHKPELITPSKNKICIERVYHQYRLLHDSIISHKKPAFVLKSGFYETPTCKCKKIVNTQGSFGKTVIGLLNEGIPTTDYLICSEMLSNQRLHARCYRKKRKEGPYSGDKVVKLRSTEYIERIARRLQMSAKMFKIRNVKTIIKPQDCNHKTNMKMNLIHDAFVKQIVRRKKRNTYILKAVSKMTNDPLHQLNSARKKIPPLYHNFLYEKDLETYLGRGSSEEAIASKDEDILINRLCNLASLRHTFSPDFKSQTYVTCHSMESKKSIEEDMVLGLSKKVGRGEERLQTQQPKIDRLMLCNYNQGVLSNFNMKDDYVRKKVSLERYKRMFSNINTLLGPHNRELSALRKLMLTVEINNYCTKKLKTAVTKSLLKRTESIGINELKIVKKPIVCNVIKPVRYKLNFELVCASFQEATTQGRLLKNLKALSALNTLNRSSKESILKTLKHDVEERVTNNGNALLVKADIQKVFSKSLQKDRCNKGEINEKHRVLKVDSLNQICRDKAKGESEEKEEVVVTFAKVATYEVTETNTSKKEPRKVRMENVSKCNGLGKEPTPNVFGVGGCVTQKTHLSIYDQQVKGAKSRDMTKVDLNCPSISKQEKPTNPVNETENAVLPGSLNMTNRPHDSLIRAISHIFHQSGFSIKEPKKVTNSINTRKILERSSPEKSGDVKDSSMKPLGSDTLKYKTSNKESLQRFSNTMAAENDSLYTTDRRIKHIDELKNFYSTLRRNVVLALADVTNALFYPNNRRTKLCTQPESKCLNMKEIQEERDFEYLSQEKEMRDSVWLNDWYSNLRMRSERPIQKGNPVANVIVVRDSQLSSVHIGGGEKKHLPFAYPKSTNMNTRVTDKTQSLNESESGEAERSIKVQYTVHPEMINGMKHFQFSDKKEGINKNRKAYLEEQVALKRMIFRKNRRRTSRMPTGYEVNATRSDPLVSLDTPKTLIDCLLLRTRPSATNTARRTIPILNGYPFRQLHAVFSNSHQAPLFKQQSIMGNGSPVIRNANLIGPHLRCDRLKMHLGSQASEMEQYMVEGGLNQTDTANKEEKQSFVIDDENR